MPSERPTLVIGAGMAGLAAGVGGGLRILEASSRPGGLCASYVKDGFRFEPGGGHWIFPGDTMVETTFSGLSHLRRYARRSSVFFAGGLEATRSLKEHFVPYPIQNNLWALPEDLRQRALEELRSPREAEVGTLDEWLRASFGETLYGVFFGPFHDRYMGGLHRETAPQDDYKSPVDPRAVERGALGPGDNEVGYNTWFTYPAAGLNTLAEALAERCYVSLGNRVSGLQLDSSVLTTADGIEIPFRSLVSTIPLDELARLANVDAGLPDPASAVLVLNLGVRLPITETARHGDHWLYIPDSVSGFHRVGYYSNVDADFLPSNLRSSSDYASIYVEMGFRREDRPSDEQLDQKCQDICRELASLGLVSEVLVQDRCWIDCAYTWTRAGSTWAQTAVAALAESGIYSVGRYGRWRFQGIADSFRDGLFVGAAARAMRAPHL